MVLKTARANWPAPNDQQYGSLAMLKLPPRFLGPRPCPYESWNGLLNGFFSENRDVLTSTSFGQVPPILRASICPLLPGRRSEGNQEATTSFVTWRPVYHDFNRTNKKRTLICICICICIRICICMHACMHMHPDISQRMCCFPGYHFRRYDFLGAETQ